MPYRYLVVLLSVCSTLTQAAVINIRDEAGKAIAQTMVTRTPVEKVHADLSDDGYAPSGVTNPSDTTLTRFTDAAGNVYFEDTARAFQYRARAQGYLDQQINIEGVQTGSDDEESPPDQTIELTLVAMTQAQHIASYPSNVWLSQLQFGGDEDLKKRFQLNCAFCHQQASPFMRNEKTVDQWISVFERMNSYGARFPADDQHKAAELLQIEYRELRGRLSSASTDEVQRV